MRELVATTAAGSEGWLSLSSSAGWIAVLVCSWPTARPCNQSHHHINGVLLLFTVTTRPLLTSPTWTPTELFIPARRLGQLWSAPTLLVSFVAIESLFERLDFVRLAKQTITIHYLFVARPTAADIWGLLLFFFTALRWRVFVFASHWFWWSAWCCFWCRLDWEIRESAGSAFQGPVGGRWLGRGLQLGKILRDNWYLKVLGKGRWIL